MKITVAQQSGFCFGVENAVNLASENAKHSPYMLGSLIHNDFVCKKLEDAGVIVVNSIDDLPVDGKGKSVIIRSHGAGKSVYDLLNSRGFNIIDATCPFVRRIHEIVEKHYNKGYHIVIVGQSNHPEVIATNGWCENSATIIDSSFDLKDLECYEKLCFVAQTTSLVKNFSIIKEKILKYRFKTVEIFDTICYTTIERQNNAYSLASQCDAIIVIGDAASSNTRKLYEICSSVNKRVYFVSSIADLKNLKFAPNDWLGIVAGASTPKESIQEVQTYMGKEFDKVHDQDFIAAVEESAKAQRYRSGSIVKGHVISADEKGVQVSLGGKVDGLISPDEAVSEGEYNPSAFTVDSEIDVLIINNKAEDGLVPLSKKKVDERRANDKEVEKVRDGKTIFELVVSKDTKGGLLSEIGSYRVFIPAAQIKLHYVADLSKYVGKTLRLRVLSIDDNAHKIVASQRVILEEELQERRRKEDEFWDNVKPDMVVVGEVKRINDYGAFVSVGGIDCLAHKEHLSWAHINTPADVLEIGKTYEFLVLKTDREKKRVSLGYKELQPHPFMLCMENHPIGSITTGKVVSVLPYGAFVEIEPGVEGLVHVSEAAATYVKNIEEVVHKGDEVTVKILNYDPDNHKTTLSIKACLSEEQIAEANASSERQSERKPRSTSKRETEESYTDDSTVNNPFADLFKEKGLGEEEKAAKPAKAKAKKADKEPKEESAEKAEKPTKAKKTAKAPKEDKPE